MRRRSFTLIELLVVITVISILAGLLLPALTKAREMVKLTVCLNGSKTLYLGQVQFSNDNDGFPCGNSDGGVRGADAQAFFLSGDRVQLATTFQPIVVGKYWDFAWMQCPTRVDESYQLGGWDLKKCVYVRDFPASALRKGYTYLYEISKLKPVWGTVATHPKGFCSSFSAAPSGNDVRLGKKPMNVFMADIRPNHSAALTNAKDVDKPFSFHLYKVGLRRCTMPITFEDGAVAAEPIKHIRNNNWIYWSRVFEDMRRDNLDRNWQ